MDISQKRIALKKVIGDQNRNMFQRLGDRFMAPQTEEELHPDLHDMAERYAGAADAPGVGMIGAVDDIAKKVAPEMLERILAAKSARKFEPAISDFGKAALKDSATDSIKYAGQTPELLKEGIPEARKQLIRDSHFKELLDSVASGERTREQALEIVRDLANKEKRFAKTGALDFGKGSK